MSVEAPATQTATDETPQQEASPAVVEDALVEEVSIDGMCGVY